MPVGRSLATCGACSAGCGGGCNAGCGGGCSASCGGGCCSGCGSGCGSGCCGGCGSGCGGCGGDCGTGSDGDHSHGTYDPLFHHYTMSIPINPEAPGEAKYFSKGDDVVGILSNGILLDSHEATWAYDSCNGHSDKNHQYHYHIPPQCFLKALGVPTPDDAEWWIDDAAVTATSRSGLESSNKRVRNFNAMSSQWPDMFSVADDPANRVVVGFARDGFAIFAPYDENGKLQRGSEYGGDLDECNGKTDSTGRYGYYLTVDPPFSPPCLKGNLESGYFTYLSTDKACPANGITNNIIGSIDGNSAIITDDEESADETNIEKQTEETNLDEDPTEDAIVDTESASVVDDSAGSVERMTNFAATVAAGVATAVASTLI